MMVFTFAHLRDAVRRVALPAALCLFFWSCTSTVRFGEDISDYQSQIEHLQRQIARNPKDADPLRELGIIYLRTNNFGRASEYLEMAFARDPNDPSTLFHLGLASESLGKHETALRLYEKYPDVSRVSKYRKLMAGRYEWVARRMMEASVQKRLAEEAALQVKGEELCAGPVERRAVAVYPLTYQGEDEQYAPLGRGLAELVSVDLSHVNSLRLVERARLQDLLDELQLARSDYFAAGTAPRVGCLVGAGSLVGGAYNVLAGDNLRLDARLWDGDRPASLDGQTSALQNLFELEKDLVFDVVDRMGIVLSPEERQKIEFIPTENLQAFLAFSRGLEREDAGAFGEAAKFYQQASRLDPSFRQAAARADAALGMAEIAGAVDAVIVVLYPPQVPSIDPMQDRVNNLVNTIGSTIVPGEETRTTATEAGESGAPLGKLPDPPRPPGGN